MIQKITLEKLTNHSVCVKKQNYITQDGVEYQIGEPWRVAYSNSKQGRKRVEKEVDEPYRSVIFLMWGDKPTVDEK